MLRGWYQKITFTTSSSRVFKKYINLKYQLLKRSIKANSRALPNFIIAGSPKAGTTSLFNFLKEHPEVKLSFKKEIKFFNNNFEKGIRWYKAFFPLESELSGCITGEATPTYMSSNEAPERIFEALPNIKLIFLLRDPIHRAISHFHFNQKLKIEKSSSFDNLIDGIRMKNIEDKKGYLTIGLYYSQLVNWFRIFNKDQILVIKSEDFLKDPKSSLKQVYEFLGIEEVFPVSFNPLNVGRYDKEISDANLNYLTKYYSEDQQQLAQLIGQKFQYF